MRAKKILKVKKNSTLLNRKQKSLLIIFFLFLVSTLFNTTPFLNNSVATFFNFNNTKSTNNTTKTSFNILPFFNIAHAQVGGVASGEDLGTNPKTRNPVVTATVPDIVLPTAPILISPTNESLLNDSTPTFIWQESSDNVGISYYQMYLDGVSLFDNISTTSTSNSDYNLIYNSTSGQYSLTPLNVITDGSHTWTIIAYDVAGNNNSSATWSFTIDTLAPTFVITSIGPLTTTISAQDINSIPINPIELQDNSPIFIGTGESNTTVQVTVSIPNESDQIINFNIGGSGNWNFQLGILPRDKIISLNFIITDSANNVSVLTNLQILIIQNYIVIPPVSPTTNPSSLPPSTPASTTQPSPIIKIPIIPPIEIFNNILRKAVPKSFTQFISKKSKQFSGSLSNTIKQIAPIGVAISLIVPILSFFALLLQLGRQFFWQIILKILQTLGLIPPVEPQGMVYDSSTNKPVAFALLTISSTNNPNQQITETVVTDANGIYQGIQLPKGEYIITVSHQDYKFPTNKQKPSYLTIQEFYKGEVFIVKSSMTQQLFLIPVDKIANITQKSSFTDKLKSIVRRLRLINFFWPLFIISVIITIFYPTTTNLIVLSLYLLILINKLFKLLKKVNFTGIVVNTSSSPIEDAIIRITNIKNGELTAILTTNSEGRFATTLKPNSYQIQVSKNSFIWMKRSKSQLGSVEVDIAKEDIKKAVNLNIVMKNVNER